MVAIDVEQTPHEVNDYASTFNTHTHQVLDVNNLPYGINLTQVYWSVFTDELTVKKVLAQEVIAAVQVVKLGRP